MDEWWAVLKNDAKRGWSDWADDLVETNEWRERQQAEEAKRLQDRRDGISEHGGPLCEQCKEDAKREPNNQPPEYCYPREEESISCRALAGLHPDSEHWKYAGVEPQWTQDWGNMPMGEVVDLKGDAYDEYMDYEQHQSHLEWAEKHRGEQEAAQAEQKKWDALVAEAEELGTEIMPWEEEQRDHDAIKRRLDAHRYEQEVWDANRSKYRKGKPMDMVWGLLKHA